MDEKTANELDRIEGHRFGLITAGVIFPFEADLTILHRHQSPIRDRYPVCVSGQIFENLFWAAEGMLGSI